jgi:hypothetical protein
MFSDRYARANHTHVLDLRGLHLTHIPHIPKHVTELNCAGNLLESLPELPPHLTRLLCSGNRLTTLPELPTSLRVLDCSKNYLSVLPDLTHTSLTHLICSENVLESLPTLPANLRCLSCHTNMLFTLPDMPSTLGLLWAQFNPHLNPILQAVVQEKDAVQALRNYYEGKQTLRWTMRTLRIVQRFFLRSPLSSDSLGRIGSHLSGIDADLADQIACLECLASV